MASRDMIVSAAGAGTVVIPRIRAASAREQGKIDARIVSIKRKHQQPFEERAQMVLAGSNAMRLTTALNDNMVTSQIMTQMQQAITSDAVATTKQYAMVIAEYTDISIDSIKHRTAELVDNLQGKRKQATSRLYDMVWQGKESVVDFINSAIGHKTLEETIHANEAIVVVLVNKYIAENSPEDGPEMSSPAALEAILRLDVNDPKYVELVGAQQRAGELFYFSTWGRSAVTNMNIEIRDAIEDFNGRGMPILPRSTEDQVNVDALSTAHEYAAALVRPDPADADATDKWVKFMLYLGLSEIMDSDKDFTGVNGAKYYGVPASMRELEQNLREGFVETTGQDLANLEHSWGFYSKLGGPRNTGESSVGYLSRINAIKTRLDEDGASEIDRVIDYIRGNKAQVKEMYPGVHWGHAEAFMAADEDYNTAKAATAASAEGGDLRGLQDRANALHADIKSVYDEYQRQKPAAAITDAPAPERKKYISPEERARKRERAKVREARNIERGASRSRENSEDEGEGPGFGGGRATKKRRPSRVAKKTRKGKRGKVGRMSRKTRKARKHAGRRKARR
jgi:hypothetical protein